MFLAAVNILQECYGNFRIFHMLQTNLHLLIFTGFKVVRGREYTGSCKKVISCSRHLIKLLLCSATRDRFSLEGTTRPVFLTKHYSCYWRQQIAALCTEASNRHRQAARGAGRNKLISHAGFLKPLERNTYISNQNISLLRRAVYQNEHFHSLAGRPAEMLLFYECAKSSSLDLFQCPC